jgi:hypothetical protein
MKMEDWLKGYQYAAETAIDGLVIANRAARVLREMDLSAVNGLYVRENNGLLCMTFWMPNPEIVSPEDRIAQREFVHAVAEHFKVKLTKKKDDFTEGIYLSGENPETGSVDIHGYLPPSCKLVPVEEPLSESEIRDLRTQLERGARVRMKVECPAGEGKEAEEGAAVPSPLPEAA